MGRKDKVEILGQKRTILLTQDQDGNQGQDPSAEESVFSSCLCPTELYQEMLSSYCATCVVDVSPGQGEFLKGCLASRTKAVAVCGTELHGTRLELLLTDYILGELSREGSTFYRPELKDETEAGPKKKPKSEAKPKAVDKKRPRKSKKDEEDADDDEFAEVKKPKTKKPKKNVKQEDQEDGEDSGEKSSDSW